MAGRVLSDASPLIGLARVDGLGWLNALFGVVWVPREVRDEVLSGRELPDEQKILAAFAQGGLRVCERTPAKPELPDLDEGEVACIRLALADTTPALLLMDELAGRAHRPRAGFACCRHGRGNRHGAHAGFDSLGPRCICAPACV
jgi:predicted nucleic acid-binding protein